MKKKDIIFWIVIALLFILIILKMNFIFGVVKIQGASMEPTYYDGNRVLVAKTNNYARGDIIITNLNYDRGFLGEYYIKRIVAVPGDTILVDQTGTYVNGEYYSEATADAPIQINLSEDEYYVLGDNFDNSKDSRIFGPIKADQIEAEVINFQ